MMDKTRCVIWWGGPSSQHLIDQLPPQTFEIGCNHIREWRAVDCVVAYDRVIVERLSKHTLEVPHYTQPRWARQGWHHFQFDKHYQQVHCSGTLAVEVALHLGHKDLVIIGADWHLTNQSLQQKHYEFRQHIPNKMPDRKRKWLTMVSTRCSITWIHQRPAAWMAQFQSCEDFLRSATSE